MEMISTIVLIIAAVFGALEIILFFKLWWMCNDVKDIASTLEDLVGRFERPEGDSFETRSSGSTEGHTVTGSKYAAGQLVVVKKDESQFRIDEVIEADTGLLYMSSKFGRGFAEDEIEDFNVYWAGKKK